MPRFTSLSAGLLGASLLAACYPQSSFELALENGSSSDVEVLGIRVAQSEFDGVRLGPAQMFSIEGEFFSDGPIEVIYARENSLPETQVVEEYAMPMRHYRCQVVFDEVEVTGSCATD